jgi:DNA-binding NarL/FixJ family response regulator
VRVIEGKMTVPNEPVVLISQALPLRHLGLINIFNHLDDLTNSPKGSVNLHTSDEAEPGIDADVNYQMLIYIAGASNADRDNLERIKALRAIAPDVPLMILSDSETRKEIVSTLNVASQGFLCVGANAELALHVFSFILNRGSHFPSAIRPKQTGPSQRYPAIDCIPTPPCVMGGDNGAKKI